MLEEPGPHHAGRLLGQHAALLLAGAAPGAGGEVAVAVVRGAARSRGRRRQRPRTVARRHRADARPDLAQRRRPVDDERLAAALALVQRRRRARVRRHARVPDAALHYAPWRRHNLENKREKF